VQPFLSPEVCVPDPTTFSPAVRRFLTAPRRFAVIATSAADGTPHQAVVWYALDDGGIIVNSLVGRRWPADLRRDPRIALTVVDPDIEAELYVTAQAEAVVAATGERAVRDIQDLARRYGSDPTSFEGLERISFRLAPRSVTVHGDLD
jgi:PPOX class probable F420-dependent enzyme